jgi:hypothetical protein
VEFVFDLPHPASNSVPVISKQTARFLIATLRVISISPIVLVTLHPITFFSP